MPRVHRWIPNPSAGCSIGGPVASSHIPFFRLGTAWTRDADDDKRENTLHPSRVDASMSRATLLAQPQATVPWKSRTLMFVMGITRTKAGYACAEPPPVSALTRISDIKGNQLKSFRTEGLQDSAPGPESHVEADSPRPGRTVTRPGKGVPESRSLAFLGRMRLRLA